MHTYCLYLRTRALVALSCLVCLVHVQALAWPSKVRIGKVRAVRKVCRNGLKAVGISTTNQTAAVFMVVGVGQRHEGPSTTGLAHLAEHAMFSGTSKVGPDQLQRRVRAMGGRANAYTRHDYTLYYDVGLPPSNLTEVLSMEADRLQNLAFDKDAFRREQKSLEEEEHATHSISAELDALIASVVYRSAPSDVKPPPQGHTHGPFLPMERVKQFYSTYYRPDNTVVVVVCPLAERETLRLIEDAFAALQRGPGNEPGLPLELKPSSQRRAVIPSRLGRDRIEYAWEVPPTGHADGHALDVLVQVLRLRGLQRDPVVSIRMDQSIDGGLLRMYATGDNAQQSLDALLDEFCKQAPGREEVKKARLSLRTAFEDLPLHSRPYFSLPAMIGVYEVLGLPRYLEDYSSRINRVSARDLARAADEYIGAEERYTIVFQKRERKQVKWPVDPAGLGKFAQEADASGDFDLAIEAYSRLLAMTDSAMYKTIYLTTRGQLQVKVRNYDAAVADFEAALKITDYPAIKPLLEEARALQKGYVAESAATEDEEPPADSRKDAAPSDLKEQLLAMIPKISKELEEWRGLKFKRPVQVSFAEASGALKGWYDTKTAALVVALEDGKPRFSRGVLLHELYHALQDQHFGLAGVKAALDNGDARRAVQALIEGEAMLAVSELMQYDFKRHARLPAEGPIKKDRFEKIFHYGAGMSFAEALRKRGGWDAVAAAYRDPPQSTREIYRPALYPAHQVRPESFPSPDGEVLQKAVVGCYDIYLLLASSEAVRAEALEVATRAVWSERYELRSGDEKRQTSWVVRFERKKDGKKFARLLTSHPDDFPVGVEVRGATVVLTEQTR